MKPERKIVLFALAVSLVASGLLASLSPRVYAEPEATDTPTPACPPTTCPTDTPAAPPTEVTPTRTATRTPTPTLVVPPGEYEVFLSAVLKP